MRVRPGLVVVAGFPHGAEGRLAQAQQLLVLEHRRQRSVPVSPCISVERERVLKEARGSAAAEAERDARGREAAAEALQSNLASSSAAAAAEAASVATEAADARAALKASLNAQARSEASDAARQVAVNRRQRELDRAAADANFTARTDRSARAQLAADELLKQRRAVTEENQRLGGAAHVESS